MIDLKMLSDSFTNILLDAYGVFWGGNKVGILPGSKEAMERLVADGKTVGILSNSTQLAKKEIEKFAVHGLFVNKHFHFVITSGELARNLFLKDNLPFATKQKKFFLFGETHPKYGSHQHIFEGTLFQETFEISEADFIYPSIPHINGEDQTDPEVFQEKLLSLKNVKVPMVCANPDHFAHEGQSQKAVVRQGSIAKMFEEMGGEVFYIGKPSPKAFEAARKQFNENCPSKILMIGDTPETDIRGANQFGMASILLTKSGIMAGRTISDVPKADYPTYLMERFA